MARAKAMLGYYGAGIRWGWKEGVIRGITQSFGEGGGWDFTELLVASDTETQLHVRPHQRLLMSNDPHLGPSLPNEAMHQRLRNRVSGAWQDGGHMPSYCLRVCVCYTSVFWEWLVDSVVTRFQKFLTSNVYALQAASMLVLSAKVDNSHLALAVISLGNVIQLATVSEHQFATCIVFCNVPLFILSSDKGESLRPSCVINSFMEINRTLPSTSQCRGLFWSWKISSQVIAVKSVWGWEPREQ